MDDTTQELELSELRPRLEARHRTRGVIQRGDTIQDFRGNDWVFNTCLRPRGGGRTGKIEVKDPVHGYINQFYDTVFDIEVVQVNEAGVE